MQVEGTQRDGGAVILASVVEKAINSGFQRMVVQACLSYCWEAVREESWLGPGLPMDFQVQIHSDCAFLTSSALVKGILCREELFQLHSLQSQQQQAMLSFSPGEGQLCRSRNE